VLSWVAGRHPTLPRPALVGWSRGAAVSLLVAGRRPDLMSALVVFGFVYDPTLHYPAAATPAKPLMVKNTRADAMSDFVSPEVTPRAVVEAFVAQALGSDPVAVDLRNDHEMSAIDPARIAVPTLVLFGERDVNVPAADGAKFFARLGAADKQMVSLRGAGHAAQLEDTHEAWVAAVTNFMARPPAGR
jgi:pimeloyl-ACP methyl ester carboxylesterase